MQSALEYHRSVISASTTRARDFSYRPVSALLALFGFIVLAPLIFSCKVAAQINGAPPSVTSPGFGGRAINGTAPGVTSLGRNGYAPNFGANFHPHRNAENRRRHTMEGSAYYPYVYALPVPYSLDAGDSDSDTGYDPDYLGGPTIFDRRGQGRDSYIPPSYNGPAHSHSRRSDSEADSANARDTAPLAPEPPQPSTMLVFKDGRQVEVGNYAIVSQILYDLTSGQPRKISLGDLDLQATQKENDDRGVIFQLPPVSQAN